MNVKEITDKDQWNGFTTLNNATFLHSWGWGEFNKSLGYKIWRFGLYKDKSLIAVFLVIKIEAKRGTFLFIPHGPIFISGQQSIDQLSYIVDGLKTLAKSEKCSFVRIAPGIENTSANNALFKHLGFINAPMHMHSELCWILDIRAPEDELLKNMRKTTRYLTRQKEKFAISVTQSTNIESFDNFYKIYKKTEERHGFVGFGHNYLKKEFEVFHKGNAVTLYFAHHNNMIVATAMIIHFGNTGYYHHGASYTTETNVPAAYVLQWEIIKDLKLNNLSFYNFWGVAPETKSHHPWQGLSRFKRGFGGSEKEFIHTQDLVIGPLYLLNWTIETVRRIKRSY